jgi:hypothetical protein
MINLPELDKCKTLKEAIRLTSKKFREDTEIDPIREKLSESEEQDRRIVSNANVFLDTLSEILVKPDSITFSDIIHKEFVESIKPCLTKKWRFHR